MFQMFSNNLHFSGPNNANSVLSLYVSVRVPEMPIFEGIGFFF